MRPTENAWEGDPRQIVEIIPVPRNDSVPGSFVCHWLQKHAPNDACKCFEGKKYDV